MAWKCPNCETLNQDPTCVVCGAPKPAEPETAAAQDGTESGTDAFDAQKRENKRKARQAVIVIVVGVIAICVIGAITALALSNIDGPPSETSQPQDLDTDAQSEPETEPVPESEPETETLPGSETEPESEPVTEPETEPVTEPETEKPAAAGEILSVVLNTDELSLKTGEKYTLRGVIKYTGTGADNRVTWKSSDIRVATVVDGTVTAMGPGRAVIGIYTVNGKTDTCTVTVTETEAAGVSLSASSVTLAKGSSHTLTAAVFPAGASDSTLTWTTSDAGVVRCTGGVLYAVGAGKATVTVRTANGKTDSCAVTVTETPAAAVSVTLDESERTVRVGESFTLTAEVMPEAASGSRIIWSSSDKKVAECIGGRVTARMPGVTVITAKTTSGKTATCTVTVTAIEAESVTLSDVKLSLNVGDIVTLTAVVNPADTTDKTLVWRSGNADIVLCENGKLTAKAPGTVYISVLTANGREAICTVDVSEVKVPVTSVELGVSELMLEPGDLYTFKVAVFPENATDRTLTWKTYNAGVAQIIGTDGAILAAGEGTAVITATASNGKSASCTVTVKKPEPQTNPESDFVYSYAGTGAVVVNYIGQSPEVVIPEKLGGFAVAAIGDSAFNNKAVTSVKIPSGVKNIGAFAFANCSLLTAVNIPEGTEFIGDYAFAACAVNSLVLPSTLAYIGEGAFGNCGNLANLTVSAQNSYYTVIAGILYDKNVTKLISFPAGLFTAPSVLPVSLTEIGPAAFFGNFNLNTIILPENVTAIGNRAFAYCGSLTAVELPSGLVSIGAEAFLSCGSLNGIRIPENVAVISERTFTNCTNLASAVLYGSITYIADDAFTGCGLLVITCPPGSYAEQYAQSKGIPTEDGI